MSSPFLAEIRIFACNFAPAGWAQCNGQILPISQNVALFSLLGTMYGGDGKSTFALPDLQGSAPMAWGQSSTGTQYFQGQQAGAQSVTLLQSEMPAHTHFVPCNDLDPGTLPKGTTNDVWAETGPDRPPAYADANVADTVSMDFTAIAVAGGSLPHNNMQPYLVLNFCIAMQGVFPARS